MIKGMQENRIFSKESEMTAPEGWFGSSSSRPGSTQRPIRSSFATIVLLLGLEFYSAHFNHPSNGNVMLVIANLQLPRRLGNQFRQNFLMVEFIVNIPKSRDRTT